MFEIHFNELLILSKHLNHLVRSVVNGATTYYPSASYKEEGEKPLPVFDHPPQIRFGFGEGWGGAGGQKVAERQSTGDSSTLSWLIPDQLGSTNVTANADGRGGCTPEPRGGGIMVSGPDIVTGCTGNGASVNFPLSASSRTERSQSA